MYCYFQPPRTQRIVLTDQSPVKNAWVGCLNITIGKLHEYFDPEGTLRGGRYKSAQIDSERYLLTCSRYFELNPVRAGMVTGPGQYRWSSYRTNSLGRADRYVMPHALYQHLGPNPVARCQAYRALFNADVSEEALELIRENT